MRIFEKRPLAMLCAVFLSCFAILFRVTISIKITVAAICMVAFLIYILLKHKVKLISVVIITVAIASVFSACYFDFYVGTAKNIKGIKNNVVFKIDEITYRYRSTAYINGSLIEVDGKDIEYKFHLGTQFLDFAIKEGDIVKGKLDFKDFSSDSKGFNEERYYRSKGIWLNAVDVENGFIGVIGHKDSAIGKTMDKIHRISANMFETHMSEESASLLSALVLGDRDNIDPGVKRDFERNGVSHMLSISGMHLSIIVACLTLFAKLFHVRRQIVVTFIVILCVFYIFLTNGSPSILRSGIMLIIMSVAFFAARANDPITTLFVTLTLIVVCSPSSVFDVGLILSFTSTLGIITIVGIVSKKLKVSKRSIVKRTILYFIIALLTTVSALAFSIIPMVTYFDSFSYVSVLSNLILGPVITLVLSLVPLFFVIYPITPFAVFIGFILDKLCILFISIMHGISRWNGITESLKYPYVEYTLLIFVLGVIFAIVVNRKRVLVFSYVLWFVAYSILVNCYDSSYQEFPKVVFSCEGGNDAVIVRKGAETYYLDFGKLSSSSANRMFNILTYDMYATELDHWVVSKYTDRSVYTLEKYINKEYIANIYLPRSSLYDDITIAKEIEKAALCDGVNVIYYDYNKSFTVDDIELYITEPVMFEGTSVKVNSADIDINGVDLAYYGMGYFDYGSELFDADITFVGNSGTRRKQKNSPEIKCDKLICGKNNEIAIAALQCENAVIFNDEDKSYSMRIGTVNND